MKILFVCCLATALLGCREEPGYAEPPGGLALSLASEAGGITYRLHQARFLLEGPERREFGAGDEPLLMLELPPGAYMLTLLDGYTLTRAGDAGALEEVEARLVSANPASVLVTPGQTTQLSLRFELATSASSPPPGRLAIDLTIADAGAGGQPTCAAGLRVNELDYEQAGSDEGEFVEIVNRAACDADLTDVVLELVNGGDGRVYARYALAQAGPSLASDARLVLGDPAVLSALPAGTASLALNGSGLQNGPDGVRLVQGEQVLDAITYEGSVVGIDAGTTVADDETRALGRCPDGFDSGDVALDFRLAVPSPGEPNACE